MNAQMVASVAPTTNQIIIDEHQGAVVYEVTIFDPDYGPDGYTILHTGTLASVADAFARVGKRVLAGDGVGEYVIEAS